MSSHSVNFAFCAVVRRGLWFYIDCTLSFLWCRITNEEKDVLIADLVSGLTNNGPSAVQVAYEMLCGPATALRGTVDMDMVAHLSDFADQCGVLLLSRGNREHESRREEDKKDDAKSC